jgi:hypothetical protein
MLKKDVTVSSLLLGYATCEIRTHNRTLEVVAGGLLLSCLVLFDCIAIDFKCFDVVFGRIRINRASIAKMESIESGGYPSPYLGVPLIPLGGASLGNPFVPNDC